MYALKYVKDPSTKVAVEGCAHTIAERDTGFVARILLNQSVPPQVCKLQPSKVAIGKPEKPAAVTEIAGYLAAKNSD
ncbi:hypothetical protein RvY_08258 [Ramazzottius varieornatus]|uniref:Uncharacterized protein n=1 Tax=Ramazzottius varieornatus TaxID=947166 RepID=A0A1D1VAX6_RAMVA|nr:hypothetical protein RvY_08258 [Ramazzottius varieornatus]